MTHLPPIQVRHPDFLRGNYHTDADDIQTYIGSARLNMADLRAGEAVIILKIGFTISGIVVDEQENAIAGAAVKLGPHGSFAVDDVPSGTYVLTAQMLEAPVSTVEPNFLKGHRASIPLRREISVPEVVQGATQEPLDLGTLMFRAGTQEATQ